MIIGSVLLSALAQISMRKGMSSENIQSLLASSASAIESSFVIASNPFVVIGLLMYGFSAAIWLLVLAKIEVTMAYPFVGLGFILTAILGFLILKEPLSTVRIMGTILIAIGVVMVSRS
jgi:multidrug transporter EmrE-like cation transporter